MSRLCDGWKISGLLGLLALSSSCGILIGNVKPVDEKSRSYGVMDLSDANPDWIRLDPEKTDVSVDGKVSPTEIPDAAYQSRTTASIISIDSACRAAPEDQTESLNTLTQLLFLGMTDITLRKESPIVIPSSDPGGHGQGTQGLETTVRGKLNGEQMMLRAVVLRRSSCVYDLVYIARPENFDENEADFSHFVASLRVK